MYDVAIVGSGMGSLTAACLLANDGLKVAVLEQNYLPGGCTSAYWRKGFIFESGATTLVGLDEHMPLKHLLDTIQLDLPAKKLELPMLVHLKNGQTIHRYQDLDQWIAEAERVFGAKGQRSFWTACKEISDFVWETSLIHRLFPPSKLSDLWEAATKASFRQVKFARHAFGSMHSFLRKYGLLDNTTFVEFVNEQLLITAQNHIKEVNVLFGATALCYTNYGNYYIDGGLINLIQPLIDFIESKGSEIHLRTAVESIHREEDGHYALQTKKQDTFKAKHFISGIPINNTLPLLQGEWGEKLQNKYYNKQLFSESLNSAFQMGIGFKLNPQLPRPKAIHQQIHLSEPLPQINAQSIFLSLSHPDDPSRADEPNCAVASISTHVHDPENTLVEHKEALEKLIIQELEKLGVLRAEDIIYQHSSTPKGWQKWTWREWGFVGGYPQYMRIKPWQMLDARLDGKSAYICGDTTYPGQGIPGVTLSGIIAYEKLKADHLSH